MIPILYTTHNRLDFTKKSLPALLENTKRDDVIFYIIDTGSDDGTVGYLRSIPLQENIRISYEEDMRLSEAMAFFFNEVKDLDFEYAAKVDNDTIVPENWLENMIHVAKKNNIDIMQARHYILNNRYNNWYDWTRTMDSVEFNGNAIYYNSFVGGSGIVFKKKTMVSFENEGYSQNRLHGWTQTQSLHPEWTKAFYDGVFIELLDMEGDNKPKYEIYPDYYSFTNRK